MSDLKPICLSGKAVTKVYGLGEKKNLAVNHVNFEFHEGELVSIVGESGSGKTTLAKMLLGLTSVSEGEIFYQGELRDIKTHRKKKFFCMENLDVRSHKRPKP
jgi:peptide/nickel transport system ATP-binding protein